MDAIMWLLNAARVAARDAHNLTAFATRERGSAPELYLYFREGEIVWAKDHPGEGWTLAHPQRFSPAWSMAEAIVCTTQVMRTLPCLPPVKVAA